jgi:cerevisin
MCAGLIGSRKYGVAKKANLFSVAVFRNPGEGTNFNIVDAIQYVWDNRNTSRISIINLSLVMGIIDKLTDDYIAQSFAKGIYVVASAGNYATDACTMSPAHSEYAIAVGAIDNDDNQAYFSGHGPCVDIFANGWVTTTTSASGGESYFSGTSASAPIVAGSLAVLASADPSKFRDVKTGTQALLDASTQGMIQDLLSANTVNKIVFVSEGNGSQAPIAVVPILPSPVASSPVASAPVEAKTTTKLSPTKLSSTKLPARPTAATVVKKKTGRW